MYDAQVKILAPRHQVAKNDREKVILTLIKSILSGMNKDISIE